MGREGCLEGAHGYVFLLVPKILVGDRDLNVDLLGIVMPSYYL